MIPTLENNSCALAGAPSPADLVLLFERFMAYWRGTVVHLTGLEEATFGPDPIECAVEWGGRAKGRLALKFDPSFYPWLVDQQDFRRINLSTEDELLKEITALYGLYFLRFFAIQDLMENGPLTPRRLSVGAAALPEPDRRVWVRVEKSPVEIKLWWGAG
ncbi:MAG TPA: hypothetical protein VMU88_08370 [bacterium]|nr:hypothetical protein [bacterium]